LVPKIASGVLNNLARIAGLVSMASDMVSRETKKIREGNEAKTAKTLLTERIGCISDDDNKQCAHSAVAPRNSQSSEMGEASWSARVFIRA
jgi:hypothetical protein